MMGPRLPRLLLSEQQQAVPVACAALMVPDSIQGRCQRFGC